MSLSGLTLEHDSHNYDQHKSFSKHIMLVDDEASILKSAQRCLANSEHTLVTFESAEEALHSAHHQAYDLIISDQRMPGMDGIELLVNIQKIQPLCVNIILSGFNNSETLLDAINKAHIYRFISKPWDNHEFCQIVEQALLHGEQQAEMVRLADQARVRSGTMTKHRAQLRELESKYPGITHVARDANGAIILSRCQSNTTSK